MQIMLFQDCDQKMLLPMIVWRTNFKGMHKNIDLDFLIKENTKTVKVKMPELCHYLWNFVWNKKISILMPQNSPVCVTQ